MFARLISNDLPRSRILAVLLVLLLLALAAAPFIAPKVALFSNILLMVAILLWRPQGIYPVAKR